MSANMVTVWTVVLLSAWLCAGCGKDEQKPAKGVVTAGAPAGKSVAVEFEALKGKWLRTDGDYTIEIKKLLDDQALETAYFNPAPIHVGSAKLYKERGFTKLFVKLQDVNYPGSSYTLIYDKANDQLCGTYFQAVQGVEYQVVFMRMPASN